MRIEIGRFGCGALSFSKRAELGGQIDRVGVFDEVLWR